MKRKYTVEFTFLDGTKELVEFITDDILTAQVQWMRNRPVSTNEILEVSTPDSKQMLLG